MKSLFIILILLSFYQIQSKEEVKNCQFVLDEFTKQLDLMQNHFLSEEYDELVGQNIILSQIIHPIESECPVLVDDKLNFSNFQQNSCTENLQNVINLYQQDIISNCQQIKNILNYLSENCLPYDFQENGYENMLNFSQEEKSAPKLCVACNIYMTLLTNYVQVYQITDIDSYIDNKIPCNQFKTGLLHKQCIKYIEKVGPILKESLKNNENSDQICYKLNACNGWQQCSLHTEQSDNFQEFSSINLQSHQEENQNYKKSNIVFQALPSWVDKLLDRVFDKKLPLYDIDNDRYGTTYPYFRGTNWRGTDCSPYNKKIYPGRKQQTGRKGADYNCNGIKGYNTTTGVPYKDIYCSNSGQMGSATIGDSAGAHFEIPPAYLNVSMWNDNTFDNFWPRIFDVFDIPSESAGTGWKKSVEGHSFYSKLVQRNKCNHNDFQNLGVNGNRSRNMYNSMLALARNIKTDYPLLIFWELIGNDVCGSTPDSMTQPEEFRKNILRLWNKLDTMVPKGSHMVVTGIAEGQILYECLENREHPLGVKYPQFYDFLLCMDSTPCAGWMNKNATIRAQTTARARQLNQIQQEIIQTTKFKNMDIQYYDFPIHQIISTVEDQGGHCWDVIEPSDGFHPNGIAEKLWADILWENLERDHPDWLGEVNPYNEEIQNLFQQSDSQNINKIQISLDDIDHIELQ